MVLFGVELVARQVKGRSELAAFADTAQAASDALSRLAGLTVASEYRAGVTDRVIEAFRRALIATHDRWSALEREFPTTALTELHVSHPRARPLLGHTIDPDSGALYPAYAAVRRGKQPLFTWWSAAGGFYVPAVFAPPRPEASTTSNPCDWLGGLDCSAPCELLELVTVLDCDPGCL